MFKDQGDKLRELVRGVDQQNVPSDKVIHSVIEEFSTIYGRQYNPEDGLVSEDILEPTANEYFFAL